VDDEYQTSGNQDPKILLTTAHDPSDRLKRFSKELRFIFPNSQRINRGTQTLGQIGKKF
jgi:U3 small nucleolar ribonucleoprotein protein IMP4